MSGEAKSKNHNLSQFGFGNEDDPPGRDEVRIEEKMHDDILYGDFNTLWTGVHAFLSHPNRLHRQMFEPGVKNC